MSKHEEAISQFIISNQGYERHGLRKKLNDKYEREYVAFLVDEENHCAEAKKDLEDYRKNRYHGAKWRKYAAIGFIPDAFKIEWDVKNVSLLEIVDGCPVSKKKMVRILDFWFDLDNDDWSMELRIIDLTTGADSTVSSYALGRSYSALKSFYKHALA